MSRPCTRTSGSHAPSGSNATTYSATNAAACSTPCSTAAAAAATAAATATATTATVSEQRAGARDQQCRYREYCKKLGYSRHDDLRLKVRPRPANAYFPSFIRNRAHAGRTCGLIGIGLEAQGAFSNTAKRSVKTPANEIRS
jgi:hypothetical protein